MQPTLKMQYKTFSISAKTSEKQLNKNQSELSKSESTGITVNIKLLLQMLNPAIMLSVSVESGLSSCHSTDFCYPFVTNRHILFTYILLQQLPVT